MGSFSSRKTILFLCLIFFQTNCQKQSNTTTKTSSNLFTNLRDKCSQKNWLWKNNACQDPNIACKKQGDLIWHNKQCLAPEEISCESNNKNLWDKEKKICISEKDSCEAQNYVWEKNKCIEKEVSDCQDKGNLWDQEQNLCVSNEEVSCLAQSLIWNNEESRCVLLEETSCIKLASLGNTWKEDHCESPEEKNCSSAPETVWFEKKCLSKEDFDLRQHELQCNNTQKTWIGKKCYDNPDEGECVKNGKFWAKKGDYQQNTDTCISLEQKRCYDTQGNTWKNDACVCVDPSLILSNGECLNKEKKECLDNKKNWIESGQLRQQKNICLTDEQTLCYQLIETEWVNNTCRCTDTAKKLFNRICTPIAKAECLEKKNQNFVWDATRSICKSPAQVACEQGVTFGSLTTWADGRCMTTEESRCLGQSSNGFSWNEQTQQCKTAAQVTCENVATNIWLPTDSAERQDLNISGENSCISLTQYNCAIKIKNGSHNMWSNNSCNCATGFSLVAGSCIANESINFTAQTKYYCVEKNSSGTFNMVDNFIPTKDSWKKGCKSNEGSYAFSKTYVFKAYSIYFEGLEKYCFLKKNDSATSESKIGQGRSDCDTSPTGWSIAFIFYASPVKLGGSLNEFCVLTNNKMETEETTCPTTLPAAKISFYAVRNKFYEPTCIAQATTDDECPATAYRNVNVPPLTPSVCTDNATGPRCKDSCESDNSSIFPNIYKPGAGSCTK